MTTSKHFIMLIRGTFKLKEVEGGTEDLVEGRGDSDFGKMRACFKATGVAIFPPPGENPVVSKLQESLWHRPPKTIARLSRLAARHQRESLKEMSFDLMNCRAKLQ